MYSAQCTVLSLKTSLKSLKSTNFMPITSSLMSGGQIDGQTDFKIRTFITWILAIGLSQNFVRYATYPTVGACGLWICFPTLHSHEKSYFGVLSVQQQAFQMREC